MNFAFPAIVILALMSPGLVFRYFYARGRWKKTAPVIVNPIQDEIVYSATVAFIFHAVGYVFVKYFAQVIPNLAKDIDFQSLLYLLIGVYGKENGILETAVNSISDYLPQIGIYFVIICSLSGATGYIWKTLLTTWGWDLKNNYLKTANELYYILSGRGFDPRPTPQSPYEPDLIYVAAVIQQGSTCFLYHGVLLDYIYDKSGGLTHLILKEVYRRKLDGDREAFQPRLPGLGQDSRYYRIEGDFFLISCSELKTLNFEYIYADEIQSNQIEDNIEDLQTKDIQALAPPDYDSSE